MAGELRALPADKAAARRTIRAARRQHRHTASDDVWRQLADDLAAGLLQWLAARSDSPRCVASYESLPTEPPTDALTAALHAAGTRLLVPHLLPDKDLSWRDLPPAATDAAADLGRGGVAAADVLVIPALAIGADGTRLGQGGGSYDRALARVARSTPVIAVVFDDEIVGAVPREPHDQGVDLVLTPKGGVRDLKY